jgi:hypothetical protein
VEYYRGISASIVDDDYFVYMMEQSWRITESSKIGSDVPIELVHKIENVTNSATPHYIHITPSFDNCCSTAHTAIHASTYIGWITRC